KKKQKPGPLNHCRHNAQQQQHQIILMRQDQLAGNYGYKHFYGSYLDTQQLFQALAHTNDQGQYYVENLHLFEIINPDQPRYLYADIEWYGAEQNPGRRIVAFNQLVCEALKVAFGCEGRRVVVSIASGVDEKNSQRYKHSYHYKCEDVIFPNNLTQKSFWIWFQYVYAQAHELVSEITYVEQSQGVEVTPFRGRGVKKSILDLQVYHGGQAFKLLGQSKFGSVRQQEQYLGSNNLLDHLVGVYGPTP